MKRPLGAVAMCVALVIMGWLVWAEAPPETEAAYPQGTQLYLTGRVCEVQSRQSYGTNRFWIYLDDIELLSEAQIEYQTISETMSAVKERADISYKMICITDAALRPKIGSCISLTGQFETFTHATNPGQFDYAKYYESIGIGARLNKAQILAVGEGYSVLRETLYCMREYWKERLYAIFPEKEASVLTAMLLGDKTGLNEEIEELYQDNGIIHILSISGLHITLLGMSIYRLLRRVGCPLIPAALAGGSLLILYGLLTGMGVSAVRAIGMYLLRMLGEILGRTYDMLTALGFSALFMLAFQPRYLNHTGFLLSFGSICGIGLLLPALSGESKKKLRKRLAEWKYQGSKPCKLIRLLVEEVWAAMLPGLSITLFTLPIQLSLFYEIPMYSVWINLLVLPFMNVVMLSGLAGMLIPWLGWTAIVDVVILRGYETLCLLFSELPFHGWNPGAPNIWQMIVYYVLLMGILQSKYLIKQEGMRKAAKGILAAAAILILGYRAPSELTVTFLDVGQGDCIFVQTKEEVYLFDCGSSTERGIYENIVLPFLKYEGISCLDGIFISHPDEDHMNGVVELLAGLEEDGIRVRRILLPAIAQEKRVEEFAELFEALASPDDGTSGEAAGNDIYSMIRVSYIGKGLEWESGGVRFRCLHPEEGTWLQDTNAYSLCFLVEYGRFSMLLTGDVEGAGEELLLQTLQQEEIQNLSLLKVAHHGSKYSTPPELLIGLKPLAAVISCGKENSYGHPHAELLERLQDAACKIYQTPQDGAVMVNVQKEKCTISTYCGGRKQR